MRLSNKSTFSLIGLIVLLAFVAVPVVMAASGGPTPTVTVKTPVTGTDTYKYESGTIVLPETGTQTFTLYVKFGQDVFPEAGSAETDGATLPVAYATDQDNIAADTLVATDLTFVIRNSKGQLVYGNYGAADGTRPGFQTDFTSAAQTAGTVDVEVVVGDLTVGTIALESTNSKRGWSVPITLEADLLQAAGESFSLYVTVVEDIGVFSEQTVSAATNTVPAQITALGIQNQASSATNIAIMQTLGLPSLDITSAAGTGADADYVIFKLSFSEATATSSTTGYTAGDEFEQSDLVVSNGVIVSTMNTTANENLAVDSTKEVWTVKVDPIDDKADVVLVLSANSVRDEQLNYVPHGSARYSPPGPPDPAGPSTTKPVVSSIMSEAITTGTDKGKVKFTFTFNVGISGFASTDLDVAGGTAAAPTVKANSMDKVWEVLVTPDDPNLPVTLKFVAGATVANAGTGSTAVSDDLAASTVAEANRIHEYVPAGVLNVDITIEPHPVPYANVNASRDVIFLIEFAEAPAPIADPANPGSFTVGDLKATGGVIRSVVPHLDDAKKYSVIVDVRQAVVTLTLAGQSVGNADNSKVVKSAVSAMYKSTTATIAAADGTATDAGKAVFTLTFTPKLDATVMPALTNLKIGNESTTVASTLTEKTGTGGSDAMKSVYELKVMPAVATTAVTVAAADMDDARLKDIAGRTIAIPSGSHTVGYQAPITDTTPPVVTITAPSAPVAAGANMGKLIFTYTIADAESDLKDDHIAEQDVEVRGGTFVIVGNQIIVTPASATTKVTVTVKKDAASNVNATNNLSVETSASFTPTGYIPSITITAADGTGTDAGKIIFTLDFSEAVRSFNVGNIQTTNTGLLKLSDLVEVMGTATAPLPDAVAVRYKLTVTPSDATKAVSVTIGAGVLMTTDNKAFDSAQKSHTLASAPADPTLDPTTETIPSIFGFSIPANSYVVLVRNALTSPRQDGLNFRDVPDDKVVVWANMPDLWERLFDRSYEGGGALILRSSHSDAAADRPKAGTVGISEIMWAYDVGRYGEYRPGDRGDNRNKTWLDSQWVEVHNLNDKAMKVLIYAQTGRDLVGTGNIVGNTKAGDRIHNVDGTDANKDTVSGMVVDVMTNFFNNRSRGQAGWDVPGANGNSKAGVDFISMARKGTFALNRRTENKADKPLNGRYLRTTGQEHSPDGRDSGNWEASTVRYETEDTDIPAGTTAALPLTYLYLGTPGHPNTRSPAGHITRDSRTGVASDSVIINEVANRNDVFKAYEWIELRNVSATEINLRNYLISIVTVVKRNDKNEILNNESDRVLYQFPANDNAKIAAGGVFLLVASDPSGNSSHPLAAGYNVDKNDEDQVPGTRKNPVRYKVADVGGVPGFGNGRNAGESEGTLPDSGKFVLILRRPDNNEGHRSGADGGKGVAERGKDDLDKIVDIAGNVDGDTLKVTGYSNAVSSTNLWPLRNFRHANFSLNSFAPETVHVRQRGASGLGGVNDGASGVGAHENKNEGGKAAFRDEGYTGFGYKRQASKTNFHGGTPGHHGSVSGRVDATANAATVVISEIMLSQGNGRVKLPQWIELYNPSKTHAVNLTDNAGWRLVIENPGRAPIRTIHFKSNKHDVKTILPNQTVLIVSSAARDYGSDTLPRGTVFPSTRVLNAYTVLKGETFEMASRTDALVDPKSFNIRLLDGKTTNNKADGRYAGDVSDEVGNLDGNPRTNDVAAWEFPAGVTEEGDRTSLIRIFDAGIARSGTGMVKPLGGADPTTVDGMPGIDSKYSWVHAADTEDFEKLFVRHTWYGAETDFGTPADRTGQILPVELSFFRPALQEDGKVVVRWTTESELDNAGFNILRSETRNGEYKQVNTDLIQGAGTTGEKTTYKWVDPTAKPGVVYYYQIEDVSFAGEHQVLATTKLKGLISAKNKLTTTWSELKQASQ